jgi:hypothetical protein
MESFEFIPQFGDTRVAAIIGRLKSAANDRVVPSVITERETRDDESNLQKHADLSSSTTKNNISSYTGCPEALLEFCNEIKPSYSSTMHDVKAHGAPRFSQRDMERSVQGQQIANNRQHRYDRKMKKFVNKPTRVEISQHKILDNESQSSVILFFGFCELSYSLILCLLQKFADRKSLVPVYCTSLEESTLGEMHTANHTAVSDLFLDTEVRGCITTQWTHCISSIICQAWFTLRDLVLNACSVFTCRSADGWFRTN